MIKKMKWLSIGVILIVLVGCTMAPNKIETGDTALTDPVSSELNVQKVEQKTEPSLAEGSSLSLPIPPLLEDENSDPAIAEYTLTADYGISEIIPNMTTNTLGYNGNLLGPTIRSKVGEAVIIHVKNNLMDSTTVHWHGLIVSGKVDGGPHQIIETGETWSPEFVLTQPALTAWYHPHLMGETATQVYQGLGGLWIHDDEASSSLGLPETYGVDDVPLIIQDRAFYKDGSLYYNPNMMNGAVGNVIMINGKVGPYAEVPSSWVRLRLLNGSNAAQHKMNFSDERPFYQIASDGGLLESPVKMTSIELAPGERAEIMVDLQSTQKGDAVFLMVSNTKSLKLVSNGTKTNNYVLKDQLVEIEKWDSADVENERYFDLEGVAHMVSINGESFDMNSVAFSLPVGRLEKWTVSNVSDSSGGMGMMSSGTEHSFHVHGLQFQVLSRNGALPPEGERGWKDTVFLKPGEKVEILVKFTLEGVFMYHCHNLEHEDAGMMGQFQVTE
ncbi:multicopper oxidase family protein [Fusibacter ferrireducens]|uniref:Multicopper oxidase domain-containing protein n=1 Tax=Fusibacter ferrireducens TaxID=2785058 RepID=A0ABR9ZZV0_9FIRM|nr:multicopper oxidase domain-containing protein [Fusibacter ferrireducens]MBF4695521.1 multicopper oxidase domain-containing protein [Fusibacter ferrireducens]